MEKITKTEIASSTIFYIVEAWENPQDAISWLEYLPRNTKVVHDMFVEDLIVAMEMYANQGEWSKMRYCYQSLIDYYWLNQEDYIFDL